MSGVIGEADTGRAGNEQKARDKQMIKHMGMEIRLILPLAIHDYLVFLAIDIFLMF